MNKNNKYILIVMYLMMSFCYGEGSKDYQQNKFEFNKLFVKNKYSSTMYGTYEPEKAITDCRNSIPAGGIWPSPKAGEEPLPSPVPSVSDCEDIVNRGGGFSTQMSYGCNVDLSRPDSMGAMLGHSVVMVATPDNSVNTNWHLNCSGVIVGDGGWVLTAAHCVTKEDSEFDSILLHKPMYIVPTQKLVDGSYGVPDTFTLENSRHIQKAQIQAVYIPTSYKDGGDVNQDFALLKLKDKLAAEYKPVNLATYQLPSEGPLAVWIAGYGLNEYQSRDNELHYRKSYYMTNDSGSLNLGASGNSGSLYSLGSIIQYYKGQPSAWNFIGKGDSGGPVLLYDAVRREFLVEGVVSAALGCSYSGYFARLPYPYSISVSTTYPVNKTLITATINYTVGPAQIRCVSATGGCPGHMYVINNDDKNIINYQVGVNGVLLPTHQFAKTGRYPTQIAEYQIYKHKYLFVTDFNDVISRYEVGDINGNLIKVGETASFGKAPVDIQIFGDYAYVVEYHSNEISIYHILPDGFLNFVKTLPAGTSPTSIAILGTMIQGHRQNYAFVTNERSNSISVYSVDINRGEMSKHIYDMPLSKNMGQLIEIRSDELLSNKLYLLTDHGVYAYEVVEENSLPVLRLKANLSREFSLSNTHIKALDSNTFAISTVLENKVFVYKIYNNIISLIQTIDTPKPMRLEAVKNFSGDFIYITNLNSNSLSLLQGENGFQRLRHINYVEAGGGPSLIKYVH